MIDSIRTVWSKYDTFREAVYVLLDLGESKLRRAIAVYGKKSVSPADLAAEFELESGQWVRHWGP